MEGTPFTATETPDERRHEALDTDDTKDKKDKDKKKKKSAPTIHIPRIDVEKPSELHEKRQKNDKKELLGSYSLAALGTKNESTNKDEKHAEVDQKKSSETESNEYSAIEEAGAILDAAEKASLDNPEAENDIQEDNEITGVEFEEVEDEEPDSNDRESTEIPDDITEESPSEDEPPVVAAPIGTSGGSTIFSRTTPTPAGSSSNHTPPPVATPASSTSSSVRPPIPPVPPVPPTPSMGANFNAQPQLPAAANLAPTPRPVIEQRVIEKHNHFWTGVVAGGLYEHFKHKKRENKLKKEVSNQKSQLQEQAVGQLKSQEEIHKLRAKQLEQAAEAKWQETHPITDLYSEKPPTTEQKGASKVGDIVTESTKSAAELAAIPLQASAEKSQPTTVYERPSTTVEPAKQAEKTPFAPVETVPAVQPPEDEPIQVANDRRVETSSWHRMEIDKATGRVVEDPTVAYGEAFRAERHQEVKAQNDGADQQGLTATGFGLFGGQATDGASSNGSNQFGASNDPANTTASQGKAQKTSKHTGSQQPPAVGVGLWATLAVLIVLIIIVVF